MPIRSRWRAKSVPTRRAVSTPAARARRKFLRFFPEGFHDPTYLDWERDYKWETHQRWEAALGLAEFRALLRGGQHREIAARAATMPDPETVPLKAPGDWRLIGRPGPAIDGGAKSDGSAPYGIGGQVLSDLGVKTMRLLTNNPRKFVGLQGYGLAVSEAVPLEIPASDSTRKYLKTKKDKMGHTLSSV